MLIISVINWSGTDMLIISVMNSKTQLNLQIQIGEINFYCK